MQNRLSRNNYENYAGYITIILKISEKFEKKWNVHEHRKYGTVPSPKPNQNFFK